MNFPDPAAAAGWAFAFIAALAACFERLKSAKVEKKNTQDASLLSDAKMFEARADMLAKLADDNLTLYRREHEEHHNTREYWHAKASEFNLTLAQCQDKLDEFQARPDYSDVMQFIKQQAETSVAILRGIEKILQAIEHKVH